MRQIQIMFVLFLCFRSIAIGAVLPHIPAEYLSCKAVTNGYTLCAFRHDNAEGAVLSHARGINIQIGNYNVCLMRIATSDPELLANKSQRKVSQYFNQSVFHIWWLEMDEGQLVNLKCQAAKSQMFFEQISPTLIKMESRGEQSDSSALAYPQSYCLTSGKVGVTTLGLTDKTNSNICQSFDTQLDGDYGATIEQVFVITDPMPDSYRGKRSAIVTDEEPTDTEVGQSSSYTWRDISPTIIPIMITGVFVSVFINMLLTVHTKCCTR